MSEPVASPVGASAGAMLRAARERQGLHIAALAATMKVTPNKLEALEADRYDALPDLAFARALAQAVCRTLKIDPVPVLALLPRAGDADRLEQVATGLATPFHDRPGQIDDTGLGFFGRPVFWAPVLLLLAAAVLYLLPSDLLGPEGSGDEIAVAPPAAAPDATTPAAAPPAAVAPLVVDTVHSAPAVEEPAAAPAAAPAPLLGLRASEESWVDVRDARGNVLLSRTLQAGESVALDGALPLRVTIGNVAGTRLSFRGQAVDLTAQSRDNVARLQLQ